MFGWEDGGLLGTAIGACDYEERRDCIEAAISGIRTYRDSHAAACRQTVWSGAHVAWNGSIVGNAHVEQVRHAVILKRDVGHHQVRRCVAQMQAVCQHSAFEFT